MFLFITDKKAIYARAVLNSFAFASKARAYPKALSITHRYETSGKAWQGQTHELFWPSDEEKKFYNIDT